MADKIITNEVLEKAVTDVVTDLSKNMYEVENYTDEQIAELFDLSQEEVTELTKVISDSLVSERHVYSNKKTEQRLTEVQSDMTTYVNEQIANSGNLKRKIVADSTLVTDEQYLYLIETDATNHIFAQWMLIDSTPTELGNTQIDLTGYVLEDDLNTALADYAKANEVLNADSIVNDLTTTSNDSVLSTQGISDELEKYVEVANIVTTLDDTTASDDTVPSTKTIYDELDKYVSKTDVITDLDYSSVTDTQVASARALYNRGLNGYYGGNILSGVTNFNDFVTIGKYETVMDTTNIENFPPVVKGITRFSVKVELIVEGMYRQEIEFQAGVVVYGIWFRDLIDGNWSSWRKVSTSTVEDTIAYGVSGEKFGNGANLGLYTVKNGWCFYSIEATPNADVANGDIVASGLPKPRIDFYLSLTCLGGTYSALLNTNGELKIYFPSYVTASRIDSCFCYPVVES